MTELSVIVIIFWAWLKQALYKALVPWSDQNIKLKNIKTPPKAESIAFLILILKNKIIKKPKVNIINGILLPEAKIPPVKIQIIPNVDIYLKYFFFLNKKNVKKIAKKENLCKYPPAIYSVPKKPELRIESLSQPIVLKPKIYWKIRSKDSINEDKVVVRKKYLKFKILNLIVRYIIKMSKKCLKYKIDFKNLSNSQLW